MSVLETRELSKDFAGFRAVDRVSIALDDGKVHALVGPNGAGKTTLFHMLTGFVRPSAGRIVAFGTDVTGLAPFRISRMGIARSFQITSLFDRRTVLENVVLALHVADPVNLRFWESERAVARYRDRARAILEEVGLVAVAARTAGSLPYGQKRALELALALALEPKVLLLDEPTSGMSLEDVQRTIALVRQVRAGRTVLLVEHNMGVVAELAERVIVMQQGRVIADGPYEAVRRDPAVITAYLGQTDA
ncbi:MAG: ABC transporter ATP-binding protein [Chloroflexi bacterium]|nr:MAG: ABC transporter ATP-binding protein [Chloroflexota bacterium]TMC58614.1 MAG: ABC transporter ATP-binding protein [Chloroflexota bacterium]